VASDELLAASLWMIPGVLLLAICQVFVSRTIQRKVVVDRECTN